MPPGDCGFQFGPFLALVDRLPRRSGGTPLVTPEQLALLTDTRLSIQARVIGLYVSTLGDGGRPLSHRLIRVILGCGVADDRQIMAWLHELHASGWAGFRAVERGLHMAVFCPVGPQRERSRKIPTEIRERILTENSECARCGTQEDLTLDHIIPFSHGGPHTEDNLRVLCRTCNSSRGAP